MHAKAGHVEISAGDAGLANGVHFARQPRKSVMGVEYLHLQLQDGSDLYLTEYGLPFTRHLLPENHWGDKDWCAQHSAKLRGTSTVYRVLTKKIAGSSKEIVLKWNRMGQDIPGETQATDLATAKFNSPFEEFSLVFELRNARGESPGLLYTHKPLAIYVPRRYVEAERIGRRQHIIEAVQKRHREITLDLNRQYAVMYEWIKGIDAAQAFEAKIIDSAAMRDLITRSNQDMMDRGFAVRDSKPHHIIVRPTANGGLTKDANDRPLYAMIDFELLERTPQREQALIASKRKTYLVKQVHRFETKEPFPPGLTQVTIMGVDYVYGQVDSTGGRLWVVGRDPVLYEYFLPEKWRKMPRATLSTSHKTYHTVTKDGIQLVWRVSRVGGRPEPDTCPGATEEAIAFGYNSPFEEISLSLEMADKGIATTYPRGIYMTSRRDEVSEALGDNSRYESHGDLVTPEGHPVLCPHHDSITIWGYWNGPDEQLATKDEQLYTAVDAFTATKRGLLSDEECLQIVNRKEERLTRAGVRDLAINARHLLLSLDKQGQLVRTDDGFPMVRICNYELLHRLDPTDRR